MRYTMLIADDEEIECKALGLLIKKECPNIDILGYAANGVELVHMLEKHQPDIAIVDINMPGINGIEAIEMARKMQVATKFIINTAYDDFAFAQKSLALKVDSYILKPQNRVETVAAINRICEDIRLVKENNHSREQVNELLWNIQSVIESEIIYSIFLGEPAVSSFAMWCEMHAVEFTGGIIVTIVPSEKNEVSTSDYSFNKEEVKKIIKNTLKNICVFLTSVNDTSINLMIFMPKAQYATSWKSWSFDIVTVLLDALEKEQKTKFRAGIGGCVPAFSDMPLSYQQSVATLKDISKAKISIYFGSKKTESPSDRLLNCAIKVVEHITENEIKKAEEVLESEKDNLLSESSLPLTFWMYCQNLVAKKLPERQTVDYQTFFNMVWQLLKNTEDPARRYEKLKDNIRLLGQVIHQENKQSVSPHVTQAVYYIKENFSQDISLESVAQAIGISPYYLSRLITQDLNQSFVSYLTQIRVQKAISLATTTKLSIAEIAENVGYSNPTYFCRVFKKTTGKTISTIRRTGDISSGFDSQYER